MRKHTIAVSLTADSNIAIKIQTEAGEIPDTVCDTVMDYHDANQLMEDLMSTLDAALDSTRDPAE